MSLNDSQERSRGPALGMESMRDTLSATGCHAAT